MVRTRAGFRLHDILRLSRDRSVCQFACFGRVQGGGLARSTVGPEPYFLLPARLQTCLSTDHPSGLSANDEYQARPQVTMDSM